MNNRKKHIAYGRGMFLPALFLLGAMSVDAATWYVSDSNGNDGNDGTNWTTAVKTITNGLAKASANDTVLVSNGTYYSQGPIERGIDANITNCRSMLVISNAVTLRSMNGSANTVIDGNFPAVTNRCVFIYNGGVVDGFTIRKGYCHAGDDGGGVYMWWSGGTDIVRNCIIISNSASRAGGGIAMYGVKGLIENCIIKANYGGGFGGGVCLEWASAGSTARNCLIIDNFLAAHASYVGGGIYILNGGNIENCTIVSNISPLGLGGGVYISDNHPEILNNLSNNIIYYNSAATGSNSWGTNAYYYNNCIYPLPDGKTESTNNITNDPMFVAMSSENYRLKSTSPCINAGANNQSWMTNSFDLDGRMRIRYGTVDMGCYETIYEGTIFRIGF